MTITIGPASNVSPPQKCSFPSGNRLTLKTFCSFHGKRKHIQYIVYIKSIPVNHGNPDQGLKTKTQYPVTAVHLRRGKG